mmetsp:Transcript_121580/g.389029  ORF Transcript_121580/g.389029 Transcript_121580/m.389029 type:complete len:275 (-) Transcript_121580:602-1426(-)
MELLQCADVRPAGYVALGLLGECVLGLAQQQLRLGTLDKPPAGVVRDRSCRGEGGARSYRQRPGRRGSVGHHVLPQGKPQRHRLEGDPLCIGWSLHRKLRSQHSGEGQLQRGLDHAVHSDPTEDLVPRGADARRAAGRRGDVLWRPGGRRALRAQWGEDHLRRPLHEPCGGGLAGRGSERRLRGWRRTPHAWCGLAPGAVGERRRLGGGRRGTRRREPLVPVGFAAAGTREGRRHEGARGRGPLDHLDQAPRKHGRNQLGQACRRAHLRRKPGP